MPPKTPPHRPSVSEIALALATRPRTEPYSSVEVTRSTTNGRYGFKVDCSSLDPFAAYEATVSLVELLRAAFPDADAQPKPEKTTVVHVAPKRGKAA